jgi:hypothetical protein
METVKLVDYAPHLLEVKRLTMELHRILIEADYEEATDVALKLTSESKLLTNAIKHHHENQR